MRKRSGSKAQQKRAANRGRREAAAAEGDRLRRSRRARDADVHPGPEAPGCLRRLGDPAAGRPCPPPPVAPAPESGKDRARASPPQRRPAPIRSLPVRSRDNDPQPDRSLGRRGRTIRSPNSAAPNPATPAAPPTADPVAAPEPGKIVVGTPTPGAVAKRGWIVVLASVQTRVGRRYAERFAIRVERNGLVASPCSIPRRASRYVRATSSCIPAPSRASRPSSAPRPMCTPSATGRRTSARSCGTRELCAISHP